MFPPDNNINKVILSGEHAFYNQPDYALKTQMELNTPGALPTVSKSYETKSKLIRYATIFFGTILVLPALYWGIHALAGKIIVPVESDHTPTGLCDAIGQFNSSSSRSLQTCHKIRRQFIAKLDLSKKPDPDSIVVKRITLEVNGDKVDAMIIGKPSTLDNGRWILPTLGNATEYEKYLLGKRTIEDEQSIKGSETYQMMTAMNSNVILFNYPGKGASEGFKERKKLAVTFDAVLKYTEEELAAKEVILYGHSLGSNVQKEGLKLHSLKEGIKYVAIKSRGPSSIPHATASIIEDLSNPAGKKNKSLQEQQKVEKNSKLSKFLRLIGWNLTGTPSKSKPLKCPEIILQTYQPSEESLENFSRIASRYNRLRCELSIARPPKLNLKALAEMHKEAVQESKAQILALVNIYAEKGANLRLKESILLPQRNVDLGSFEIALPEIRISKEDYQELSQQLNQIISNHAKALEDVENLAQEHLNYNEHLKKLKEAKAEVKKAKELIHFRLLAGPAELAHDQLFQPVATIAYKVLTDLKMQAPNRKVYGISAAHNNNIHDWEPIGEVVEAALKSQKAGQA